MSYISFPENLMIVPGIAPVVGAGAIVSIPISLKNVQRLWAVCYINPAGGAGAQVACVPQTDALVSFLSGAILPATLHTVPIWTNEAANTSDIWTRQADATNFTTTAGTAAKMVVFEIDPSILRTTANASADEDCFRISLTAVANTDYAAIFYIILPRYISQVDTRSYIVD